MNDFQSRGDIHGKMDGSNAETATIKKNFVELRV
jgi:hypothetical protein